MVLGGLLDNLPLEVGDGIPRWDDPGDLQALLLEAEAAVLARLAGK